MFLRSPFRVKESTAILAVLLLVGMLVAGGVWHSHNGNSREICRLCQFSHQPAAQHLALNRISAPVPISMAALPADPVRIAGPSILLNVSRAPPSA
jgi:hypothetical protein